MASLGFSVYETMLSAKRDSFASSFPIWMSVISFSYPIALASSTFILPLMMRVFTVEEYCALLNAFTACIEITE